MGIQMDNRPEIAALSQKTKMLGTNLARTTSKSNIEDFQTILPTSLVIFAINNTLTKVNTISLLTGGQVFRILR